MKGANSETRSKDQTFYLDRYSKRGSRHLVRPTWVTYSLEHRDVFTHRRFYNQVFWRQMLLHADALTTKRFRHKCFRTRKRTHTDRRRHAPTGAHTHTLAQNCHCEFCCGMHLSCKNTSVIPDRNGSVKGPEKNWEVTIAIASGVAKLKRLEQYANERHADSWLSWLPLTKIKLTSR